MGLGEWDWTGKSHDVYVFMEVGAFLEQHLHHWVSEQTGRSHDKSVFMEAGAFLKHLYH